MRLTTQGALHHVGLQASNQRGDKDDHRRADGNPQDDQQALLAVFEEKAQGNQPFRPVCAPGLRHALLLLRRQPRQ